MRQVSEPIFPYRCPTRFRFFQKLFLQKAFVFSLVTLLLFWGRGASAAQQEYRMGPPAPWVEPVPPEFKEDIQQSGIQENNARWMLFDQQIHAGRQENYHHNVKTFLNEAGVQEDSQLTISFDPTFQELTLHHVRIHRGGNVIDQLHEKRIRVIQPERRLDAFLYDGRKSVVIFLEDVRAGDSVDYAYTLKGWNPVFHGRFTDSLHVQWYYPITRQLYRLLWPKDRNLYIKNHQTKIQPSITEKNGYREYHWIMEDAPALKNEDYVPIWYDPYRWVQLSEYESWEDVVEWALPYYQTPTAFSTGLNEKIDEWRNIDDGETRVLAVLDFLQKEIRYLGIEMGPNSHKPVEPSEVFQRRYGDCKDKAYLFCSILHHLDMEASPVLVDSNWGRRIAEFQPSPMAFNHVICRVRLDGKNYWVDPTDSNQEGPLSERQPDNYGLGLVIEPGSENLLAIPFVVGSTPFTEIEETFHIKSFHEPVSFQIISRFRGRDAEWTREELEGSSIEEISERYLNYYAEFYPDIQSVAPLKIIRHDERNEIIVEEHYQIRGFWEQADPQSPKEAIFYPFNIYHLLERPSTKIRTMPWAFSYPEHVRALTTAYLPEDWKIKPVDDHWSHPAFEYRQQYRCKGDVLTLAYEYKALKDHVNPEEMPSYLETLNKIESNLGYSLLWQGDDLSWQWAEANWKGFAVTVLLSFAVLAGVGFIYYLQTGWFPSVAGGDSQASCDIGPKGLGGWLVLVFLGMITTLVASLGGIVQLLPAYFSSVGIALSDADSEFYDPFWQWLAGFGVVSNVILFAGSLLMLLLFFQKRRSFPALYVAFLVIVTLVMSCDMIFSWLWDEPEAREKSRDIGRLVRRLVSCMIWIPYMRVSKRVKATFIK